jgi:hypothetical protein
LTFTLFDFAIIIILSVLSIKTITNSVTYYSRGADPGPIPAIELIFAFVALFLAYEISSDASSLISYIPYLSTLFLMGLILLFVGLIMYQHLNWILALFISALITFFFLILIFQNSSEAPAVIVAFISLIRFLHFHR